MCQLLFAEVSVTVTVTVVTWYVTVTVTSYLLKKVTSNCN